MSITFTCPDAPRTTVPCRFCVEARENNWPEYQEWGHCDRWCQGTEEVSEVPEVNLANDHGILFLQALNLPCDPGRLYGDLEPADIPAVLRRLLVFCNDARRRTHITYEPEQTVGAPRIVEEEGLARITTPPRVISFGYTDEQVLDRFERFRELLTYASQNGYRISWD